jgi:hypothetical protein
MLMASGKTTPLITYATWNPLDKGPSVSLSGGNLVASGSSINAVRSTIGKSTGTAYWEVTPTAGLYSMIGVSDAVAPLNNYPGSDTHSWGYCSNDGTLYYSSNSPFGSAYVDGDVIGIALNMNTGKLWISLNGVWQGAGNPVAGTNPAALVSGTLYAITGDSCYGQGWSHTANFGQSPFVYPVPSGFDSGLY